MAKVAKKMKLKPFQKLLTVMISGKPVTKDEINTLLGHEIFMYRISTYMWHIKTQANGTVKVIKDGRKVKAYQLVNFTEFDANGRYKGAVAKATPAPAASVKPVAQPVTA